jgi:hypothetical protein
MPISSLNSENKNIQNLPVITALGGTVTTFSSGGVNYKVHTFTTSSDFIVESGTARVDYLIVAGGGSGGGGGHNGGGGGGAGGYFEGYLTVGPGTYPVQVGAGGVCPSGQNGQNGSNSSFNSIVCYGGGGGGNWSN